MAKRRSDEARMIEYFTSAPVEKVELMLGLLKDVLRRRTAPTKVVRVTKAKRSRVGKAATEPAVQEAVTQ